jgi:hypothetical protein
LVSRSKLATTTATPYTRAGLRFDSSCKLFEISSITNATDGESGDGGESGLHFLPFLE